MICVALIVSGQTTAAGIAAAQFTVRIKPRTRKNVPHVNKFDRALERYVSDENIKSNNWTEINHERFHIRTLSVVRYRFSNLIGQKLTIFIFVCNKNKYGLVDKLR